MPQAQPPTTPAIMPEIEEAISSWTLGRKKQRSKEQASVPAAVALAHRMERAIGTTLDAMRIPVK